MMETELSHKPFIIRRKKESEDLYIPIESKPDLPEIEDTLFKPLVFIEFFIYFIIKAFLGPFSFYLFKRFVQNGHILANNLQIYEGKGAIFGSFAWIAKIFCFTTTLMFLNSTIKSKLTSHSEGYAYNSTSQFWLLIHTEISLAVLYGAYYASLPESEVQRMKTEIFDTGRNIFNRVINLIKLGKEKLYEITHVARLFHEIDIDNFYFVYPKEVQDLIPEKLQPEPLKNSANQLKHIGIQDGLVVQCDKYATYIAEIGGYQKFDLKLKVIKYSSRGLVFINAILPVVNNIYQILVDGNEMFHVVAFLIYLVQQVCYSYLIYRLAVVYDVLFLGLLLYYKKFQMLSVLGEVIKVKPSPSQNQPLYIPTSVPQNVENWLAVRKVLASINAQAFVIIDINMSFVLLYTLLFIAFYATSSLNIFKELFLPFKQFLSENPAIQTVLSLTVIVVMFVLVVDLALGILINRLFMFEKHEWILQESVIMNIRISHEMYRDLPVDANSQFNRSVAYAAKMREFRSLLGTNLHNGLYAYAKRIREAILLVIKAVEHEEFFHPHTLLGIKTDFRLVMLLGTAISAIGASTIVKIAQSMVSG